MAEMVGNRSLWPAGPALKIGCMTAAHTTPTGPDRPLQIAIVLYEGLTALDALGPYEVLRFVPGAEVRFVSAGPGPVRTDGVLVVGATHSFADTPSPDVVLVPGSAADTAVAMADPELTGWLRRVHAGTQWTTSVCSGALILGAAGILEGHPATTHWLVQDLLPTFGATPRPHERIVRSGKVATAAGVSAGIDLGLWLLGEISGRQRAEVAQLMLEYDPRPPYDAGHVDKASEEVQALAREELLARASRTAIPAGGSAW